MKNTKLWIRILHLAVCLFISGIGFTQVNPDSQKAIDYLNNTVKYSDEIVVDKTSQTVITAEILKSQLSVNIGDPYNDAQIIQSCFLKTKNKLIPFESITATLSSPEFIENIKNNRFKLKTEQDGIAFQSLLCLIDKNKANGFFQSENSWYFIRTKFFNDITAYEITTDNKGKIIAIKYIPNLKISIPEDLLGVKNKFNREKTGNSAIAKKDSLFMHTYLTKNTDYNFNIEEIRLPAGSKISTASFYNCSLNYSETYADGIKSSSKYPFLLINNKDKYAKCRDGKGIIQSALFLESIKDGIKINTKADAKRFQDLLDVFCEVSTTDMKHKAFLLKDGIWIYNRTKSFDDIYGFMLKTDANGAVAYIDYCAISDKTILRFKMKDPKFMVNYNFKLISPSKNSITVEKGESVNIQIDFDAKMANAKGTWILTRFDGKDVGMLASTNLESPFRNEIPGKVLTNKNHILECFLLKNGGIDTEHPLGIVKINIEVK